MKRRQLLGWAGAGWAISATVASASAPPSPFTLLAYQPNGDPLPSDALQRLYFLDLADEPLPHPPRRITPGQVVADWPPAPVAVALKLPVAGFGAVTLYADRQGQGFTPQTVTTPLVLNRAFAWDRYDRVRRALVRWRGQGLGGGRGIEARLGQARVALERAERTDLSRQQQVALWNAALAEGLWAGEELALERARQRIVAQPPRLGFKRGCNAFGHPHLGPAYDQALTDLFNLATVPVYWKPFEPQPGQPNYAGLDRQVDWLQGAGVAVKGHPLVWFHDVSIPAWIRPQPYPTVKAALAQRIEAIVGRYGDRIASYDVINEAHDVPWANDLGYGPDQFLDLTRMACDTVRQGNPAVQRIVNCCCPWARNVALYGPPQRSPYRYLQACLAAGIEFEVIGLQLYYADQDLFEVDRLLDRFIALDKPIHITEMATSSATGLDPQSPLQYARGQWHGPWTAAVQADWVQGMYTLAYSKPQIQAVSWWDLSDRDSFWPFGGLIDAEQQPKAAYHRLRGLFQEWGLLDQRG